MKKVIIMAVASFFSCLQSIYPQITTNELPVSVQRGITTITKGKTTGIIDLPVPDIKKILHEDSLCQKKHPNGLKRTSVAIPVVIDIHDDGIWTTLEDGDRLWQMEVHAEKALALDFVFSKFWLPKGGKFFIFNPSTNETIGAVTSKYLLGERAKPQRFSTGIVKGDNIILEYYQPAEEKELPVIEVEKAYYTYIPAPNFLSESTCSYEVNVNCSEGNNWQLEKNAVALVYRKFVQGGGWCSGSLVNNTQNNLSPLFLTANHCLEGDFTGFNGYVEQKDAIYDNDLSDWIFYWGYELESCSSTTPPDYYNKTTVGATLVANNSYSDFALLQLHQDPLDLPNYIPYYLGWDISGSSGTGGVCIHHPNHDVKKISTYSCTPFTDSYNNSPAVYWGVQWIATANGHGIMEQASSGSPLINNSHKVIGQLKGSSDTMNCLNPVGTSDFGKLSVSWTGNGNTDIRRRLDYWLDPSGSNIINMDGLSPYSLSGPSYIIQSTQSGTYSISNVPSFYTVEWSLTDSYYNQNCLQQNYPSLNQCTITRSSSHDMMNASLTAAIKYNGVTIQTLSKTGVYAYTGFKGTYVSSMGSGYYSAPNTIFTAANTSAQVTSPSLIGATFSYSGDVISPYVLHGYDYMNINMPSSGTAIVVQVHCTNGENYSVPVVKTYYPYYMSVIFGEDMLSIIQPESVSENQTWTLEVICATTGEIVASRDVKGNSASLNTVGWKRGIYVVRATIDKEVLTEKIQVK